MIHSHRPPSPSSISASPKTWRTTAASSLSREDAGFNLIYLRTDFESFKPESIRGRHADGLLVVFVVDNIDEEYARLQREGVQITTPIQTEPWGERFFQVTDPNGVVIQLVQWMVDSAR
jgi:uncharacterized glyoxalase superfamily protein PhnB